MRVAVIAACPFPVPQGSQVYIEEQLRALKACGAQPVLFCYGTSTSTNASSEFEIVRVPAWLSPRRTRAGPAAAKPLADLSLLDQVCRTHRRNGFALCLGHNLEGGLLALALRGMTGVPAVYVAHTLLGSELPTYFAAGLSAHARRPLASLGNALDRQLAQRADGVLALSRACASRLKAFARGPVARIPPALAPRPTPTAEAVAQACRHHGLEPGRFALYAGNLDGYQGLDLLHQTARLTPVLPIVVATHSVAHAGFEPLRVVETSDPEHVRLLTYGCALALLPRHLAGGFPIKLLNYMEAARPIVAYARLADTLTHEHSAWLLGEGDGAPQLAQALTQLAQAPEHAMHLGARAREVLETEHAPAPLAARLHCFLDEVGRHPRGHSILSTERSCVPREHIG